MLFWCCFSLLWGLEGFVRCRGSCLGVVDGFDGPPQFCRFGSGIDSADIFAPFLLLLFVCCGGDVFVE